MSRRPSCLCGECPRCLKNAQMRSYYRENAEKLREASRRSRRKNIETVRARDRARGYRGDPLKQKARRAISYAIEKGRLTRGPCETCGNPKTQAHHEDYSKPLEVRWLCRTHHAETHRMVA